MPLIVASALQIGCIGIIYMEKVLLGKREATRSWYSSMDRTLLTKYPRTINLNNAEVEVLGEGLLGESAFLYTDNFAIIHSAPKNIYTCRLTDITSLKHRDSFIPFGEISTPEQCIERFYKENFSRGCGPFYCQLTFISLDDGSEYIEQDVELTLQTLDLYTLLSANLLGAQEPLTKNLKSKALKKTQPNIFKFVEDMVIYPCDKWEEPEQELLDLWNKRRTGYLLDDRIHILSFDKKETENINFPEHSFAIKQLIKHVDGENKWTVRFYESIYSKKTDLRHDYTVNMQELKTPEIIQVDYDEEIETRRRIRVSKKGETTPRQYLKVLNRDRKLIQCYNESVDALINRCEATLDCFKERYPDEKCPKKSTYYKIVDKAKKDPVTYGAVDT